VKYIPWICWRKKNKSNALRTVEKKSKENAKKKKCKVKDWLKEEKNTIVMFLECASELMEREPRRKCLNLNFTALCVQMEIKAVQTLHTEIQNFWKIAD
jgi:hypothetical protein